MTRASRGYSGIARLPYRAGTPEALPSLASIS